MIIFIPSYDEATAANLAVARHFQLPPESILLMEENATRENMLNAYNNNRTNSIFIMSHGGRDRIYCGNSSSNSAIVVSDKDMLNDTYVFAFACHTATFLGKEMSSKGNIWWGYTGAIAAPDAEDEETRLVFAGIFSYIMSQFHQVDDVDSAYTVLNQIKILCDQADLILDEQCGELGNIGARQCLLHMWDRLRVWFATTTDEQPLSHSMSNRPLLVP